MLAIIQGIKKKKDGIVGGAACFRVYSFTLFPSPSFGPTVTWKTSNPGATADDRLVLELDKMPLSESHHY